MSTRENDPNVWFENELMEILGEPRWRKQTNLYETGWHGCLIDRVSGWFIIPFTHRFEMDRVVDGRNVLTDEWLTRGRRYLLKTQVSGKFNDKVLFNMLDNKDPRLNDILAAAERWILEYEAEKAREIWRD